MIYITYCNMETLVPCSYKMTSEVLISLRLARSSSAITGTPFLPGITSSLFPLYSSTNSFFLRMFPRFRLPFVWGDRLRSSFARRRLNLRMSTFGGGRLPGDCEQHRRINAATMGSHLSKRDSACAISSLTFHTPVTPAAVRPA